jgi:D-alanine-D-alanine ligase
MKIGVLFDGPAALGASADLAILDTVEAVENALAPDGNTVVRVPVNPDGRWVERVRRGKFDLIFNLCESVDGVAELEPSVISAVEVIGVPYTGSSSWTTAMTLRKHVVNSLLDRAGLPIPRFALVHPGDPMPHVGYPAIVKPSAEDASIGVEQRSVVRNARQLAERVVAMHERWDEVLVQKYVDGREVNVGILGDQALPVAEIMFDGMPRGMWRIVSYRSKWETGCDEDLGGVPQCPAKMPKEQSEELKRIALKAWRLAGGEGYGRVDLRIDRAGKPWILEVNSNPDISPDAGLARMARVAGLEYADMIHAVCETALKRQKGSADEQWLAARVLSGAPVAKADRAALDLFVAQG